MKKYIVFAIMTICFIWGNDLKAQTKQSRFYGVSVDSSGNKMDIKYTPAPAYDKPQVKNTAEIRDTFWVEPHVRIPARIHKATQQANKVPPQEQNPPASVKATDPLN